MKRKLCESDFRPLRNFAWITFALLPLLSFTLAVPAAGGQAASEASGGGHVLALAGGTLIDGTGSMPLRDAVVVIRGNRIEAVGPRKQVRIPQGAEVLDTTNQFLLPGLIESHFHFSEWMPGELFLSFGITSAVNFGGPIAQAKPPGENPPSWPRIYFAGGAIAMPAELTILGKVLNRGNVTTPEQARELVKQRKNAGATFIQVSENVNTEILNAVTGQAHQLGMPVIGHQVNAVEAVRAGLDGVEHMTGVGFAGITDQKLIESLAELSKTKGPDRAPISHPISNPEYHMKPDEVQKIIRFLVDHHAYVNPTVVTRWQQVQPRTREFFEQYKKMSEDPYWKSIPEEVRKSWMETLIPYPEWTDAEHKEQLQIGYRKTQQFLRDFTRAGGKIFSGTDFAGASVPGLRMHQELRLLVDAGLTPMQAILATTRYPAQLFHLDKDLGTVQAGKLADLLVVEADPLQQVENLARTSRVILDGKVVQTRFRPDSIISVPTAKSSTAKPR